MPSRTKLINDYVDAMSVVQRQVLPIKAHTAASIGLSRPQAEVLYLLSRRDQAPIKQIATLLGTSSSAATQLVEGLVQIKCVRRHESPEDRRVVQVELTTTGSKKLDELKAQSRIYIEKILTDLTDAEIASFIHLLRRVAESCGANKDCNKLI